MYSIDRRVVIAKQDDIRSIPGPRRAWTDSLRGDVREGLRGVLAKPEFVELVIRKESNELAVG
jgi:hypothetical protein